MRICDVCCLLLVYITHSSPVLIGEVPRYCIEARSQCLSRNGCQMALNNFITGCEDVVFGKTKTCTTQCKNALISLLLTEDGAGISFVNCNCSGDDYCEVKKQQVEVCSTEVMEFMNNIDDKSAVSCNLARWVCEADTSCLAALQYYAFYCAKLIHGKTCSLRCNNSLDILYHQKSSQMLQTCVCDGTEDYDCQTLKDNTETLCFHRQLKVAYNTVSRGVEDETHSSASRRTSGGSRRPKHRPRGQTKKSKRARRARAKRARNLKRRRERKDRRRKARRRRARQRARKG